MNSQPLTQKQAAERLGRSPRFVRNLVKRGKLPESRPFGTRTPVYYAKDIDALLAPKPEPRTKPVAKGLFR